ncbi:GNAT family N-acetyltransferase [Methylobacterium oryzihabitans]|uniref:N-acetyltransferase family protein n=1 Tax=Methylobacterium oryzihabitans TaxID=2499852 RepID=A0A3S2VF77_9HYPH|nr:GNAT family N-acetyltransferase [Methylobacterium oryzihabitans]RVU21652.1 N-acetyltransferase family protein [Methylobacterium oryzihabitans]
MPNPLLRPGTAADIPAVARIYAHAVVTGRASFETEPPGEDEMARRRAALVAGGHPYLVAEVEGRVLGYAYAGPYRPRPAYRFTVEDSVYVDPAATGRGLGRRLLGAVIAAAARAGHRQMIAVIGDSGNAASIGLHAALGFAPAGVLRAVGWKHGTWLDTVLMQRALGPGDGTPPER